MIKHLIKYRSLVATIFVLVPFLFWFSCSEFGQFTFEKEHPATQDYCEIVKVTKAETGKAAVGDLFKLKVEKSFSPHFIDEIDTHLASLNKLSIENLYSPQKTTLLYLYNKTLLI